MISSYEFIMQKILDGEIDENLLKDYWIVRRISFKRSIIYYYFVDRETKTKFLDVRFTQKLDKSYWV